MEQATNALTNKISRFRYLLAAYFDIIIWFNIFFLIDFMVSLIPLYDVKLFVGLILYTSLAFFYLCKDAIFNGKTPGKYILGLKVISLTEKRSAQLVMRNIFGAIAIFLYSISSLNIYPYPNITVLSIVVYIVLLYTIGSIIVACLMADRKLSDCMFNTRIVEDTDNKMWSGASSHEKTLYCTITILMFAYLIYINLFDALAPILLRFLSHYYTFFRQLSQILPYLAMFIIVRKTINHSKLRVLLYIVLTYIIARYCYGAFLFFSPK